jgi:hypothetical protein
MADVLMPLQNEFAAVANGALGPSMGPDMPCVRVTKQSSATVRRAGAAAPTVAHHLQAGCQWCPTPTPAGLIRLQRDLPLSIT